MVIWLVGLSGAGKTSIGREVYRRLKAGAADTVLVDGDEIRTLFRDNRGDRAYSVEGRRRNSDRIRDLCAWLDRQEINVVCCTLSFFEETRQWNRDHLSRYFEVYVSAPMEVLERRDPKHLYRRAREGRIRNVVGVDIPFTPPASPDLVVDNGEDGRDLGAIAEEILRRAGAGG